MSVVAGRGWVATGALSGAVTVLLGAFGAHLLEDRLSEEALGWWRTGVGYQGFHALGLIAFGLLAERRALPTWARAAGWCFVIGVPLFSGSLYALALGAPRAVGAITPFGGLSWIAAWIGFAALALRRSE